MLIERIKIPQSRILSNLDRAATDDDDSPPYSVDTERGSTLSLSISEGTLVCTSSGVLRCSILRSFLDELPKKLIGQGVRLGPARPTS